MGKANEFITDRHLKLALFLLQITFTYFLCLCLGVPPMDILHIISVLEMVVKYSNPIVQKYLWPWLGVDEGDGASRQ